MNVKEVKKAHAMPIDEIIEQLETSKYGLYENEAKRRLDTYGTNEIVEKKGRTKMEILLKQINNPLNWILLIVAIITILIDHPQDAYVIFGVISINTIIGFIQEYKAENAIESLKKMGAPQAEVLRRTENDKDIEFEIPSRYVVPGDVLILNSGDKVPADARLFECMNLHVDESMLTGESVPVSKKTDLLKKEISIGDRKNMVFSGTLIVHGRAKAIVTKTGMQSEMGKIASIIQEAEEIEIPIKKGIKKLTKMLGLLALVLSISVFIIGLIKGIAIQEIMLFAVASAVSSIPEGLPIVVTVTLAIAVGKMAKRNAIIRKLKAVDTLGSISAIVSDKTGTLTTNQMTVRKIWTESHLISVTGEGYKPKGRFLINGEETPPSEHQELQKIFDIMILCNDANLRDHKDEKEEYWTVNGDPTEGALIVAAMKADIEKDRYEIEHPRVDEIPFDSAHKYMATFHKNNNSSKVLTCVKGAPEKVLLMCSKIQKGDEKNQLSEKKKNEIKNEADKLARQAYRLLAFAYLETKNVHHDKVKSRFPEIKDLVFLGMAGIIDPTRPEVKDSIQKCKNAGIKIFMATGDHKLTAKKIGDELGIANFSDRAIDGVEFSKLDDKELNAAVEEVKIFSRVDPEHKYKIVRILQSKGKVVAVTGDGINDAPAIKAAEVGIAMGISGSDVTKETADVVLVDDNFASIVNAIEEGRIVYENIRKVVKYLVSTNIGEDFIILVAFFIFPFFMGTSDPTVFLIFTAIQILWVNLVTDGVLDITLALEPSEGDFMNQKPRDPNARIIDKNIFINIVYVAFCMAIGTLSIYLSYYQEGNADAIKKAKTMAFITLSTFQVFNALNCRSRTQSVFEIGLFKNRWLVGAMVFSVVLQYLVTIIPFFQDILATTPLTLFDWFIVYIVSSSVWVLEEIRKNIYKKNKN